ncbi:MAG: acyl-CoA synthetase FdrA [Bacillota bacterium]|nr:acyl-CoA synthetase FdrA [Bacillota bacterium]
MRSVVVSQTYFDSVTLMKISSVLTGLTGVRQAVAIMATEANKQTVREAGLLVEGLDGLGATDLLIAVEADEEASAEAAITRARELLKGEAPGSTPARRAAPRTLDSALGILPGANLALISVPGVYAAAEAARALRRGLHAMVFSDNVTVEDELRLKILAREKGLLLMGPDCGTAILNGVPLAFANAVRRGSIGIVGAAGTGIQQVSVLVERLGSGVSQAIGTGGRDLSARVGGITMLQGLAALEADEETRVIVLVSKPPAGETARAVLAAVRGCSKPVVVVFLGGDRRPIEEAGAYAATTLAEAARLAVVLDRGETVVRGDEGWDEEGEAVARREAERMAGVQRYLRGLYSGGTLCDEAMLILRELIGTVYSNVPLDPRLRLPDAWTGVADTVVDLGDDQFTRGRPHPMIDPALRVARLEREAADPEVAVVLLDVVLGYGAHPDPAGALAAAITRAKERAAAEGRYLSVVASVCGTPADPQGLDEQEATLRSAGVILQPSNALAARMAGLICRIARGRR